MERAAIGIAFTMFVGAVLSGTMAKSQPPSFEVASIKANHSGERIQRFQPSAGGRFTTVNCSPSMLIEYAFQIKRYEISDAPDWVRSDKYDIVAKSEGNPEIRYIPGMVQRLLEDRFQLKYHWQTKEGAGYDLVVSKPGKLHQSEPGDCPSILSAKIPCGYLPNTPGHTSGHKLTTANLADALAFFTQAFVVDKTNLAGKYDIDLEWTPEPALMQSTPPDLVGPSIFTALQEQLGLKLESAKGPVKTLVIDQIKRPSDN